MRTVQLYCPGFIANPVAKPWLMVGKGPSFAGFHRFDEYTCLTLNHTCLKVPNPRLCFFMDLEAFLECEKDIPHTADIALPWHPHVKMLPSKDTLLDLGIPQRLGERLKIFNSSTYVLNHGRYDTRFPIIRVVNFSGDGALNLLAYYGVRTVYTVGIDGGTQYAPGFDTKDLLANGQKSFDSQMLEFARTKKKYGMEVIPLSA